MNLEPELAGDAVADARGEFGNPDKGNICRCKADSHCGTTVTLVYMCKRELRNAIVRCMIEPNKSGYQSKLGLKSLLICASMIKPDSEKDYFSEILTRVMTNIKHKGLVCSVSVFSNMLITRQHYETICF
jgi:hypothetical protein